MVCGACHKQGVTAKGVADEAKRLERNLTCAACQETFPRQKHITLQQEKDHFKKGTKVVCASCAERGFTGRSWEAHKCSGKCKKLLPKSAFAEQKNFARAKANGSLICKTRAKSP